MGHVVLNVSYTCAAEFSLRSSHGYRINVSADPAGSKGDDIQLTAERGSVSTIYIAHQTITPAGVIKASFGRLGRLSLRFRPSGRVRRVKLPKKCLKERPPVVTARLGSFVGSFRFRGERGYTAVSTHRVTGGVGDPLAISREKPQCEFHESDAEKTEFLRSVGLQASARRAGPPVSFSVMHDSARHLASQGESSTSRSGGYFFFVVVGEFAEGMRIIRLIGAVGPANDFVFDAGLTSATITAPPPFTGSGNFLRSPDGSTTWAGRLSVPIPGLGTVALAGAGFNSELATQATLRQQLEEGIEASPIESRSDGSL